MKDDHNEKHFAGSDDEECPIMDSYDEEMKIGLAPPESDVRIKRKQRERSGRARFSSGEKLIELRSQISTMRDQLKSACDTNYEVRISALTDAIASAERKDPELVYEKALEECALYEASGEFDLAAEAWREAKIARENIAQFNLHGLWVGK